MPKVEGTYQDSNGVTHTWFDEGQALAELLRAEIVFLNSHWWKDSWPQEARDETSLNVNTNDVFQWGCADAESMAYHEIKDVYRYWKKDPEWGTAIWAIIKNRELPQKPVEQRIRQAGLWDLDALIKEHGLRPNRSNGLGGVRSALKHAVYVAWMAAIGQEPLPFDNSWWDGWLQYVEAHPGWDDDAWKREEEAAVKSWLHLNGYDPEEPDDD